MSESVPKGPKSNQWFRLYAEVLHDPKVQSLPADVFRTWVNLLCLASAGHGGLPPIDDIAFTLRLSKRTTESHVSRLISIGLLDMTGDDDGAILTPHNWSQRQFVSDRSTDRVRKFRERKAKAAVSPLLMKRDETVSETAGNVQMKRVASESESVTVSVSETVLPSQEIELSVRDAVGASNVRSLVIVGGRL